MHSEQVGRRFRKAASEKHPLSEFLAGLRSGYYPEGGENTSTESIIFRGPQTLRLNLRTGRQGQKLVRLLSITDRLKVVAIRARCDDHVNPMAPRFLDVERVGPVLDA